MYLLCHDISCAFRRVCKVVSAVFHIDIGRYPANIYFFAHGFRRPFPFFVLDIVVFLWLNSFTKRNRRTTEMKEYEIHTTATYITDGGTTEGSYFVEYVTAKNLVEAKRILRAELKAAGYKNIKLDAIKA